tara:strand:+ start:468 stop:905 length:438 start_codon:yes stop_codon:yes gene_type:complete
MKKSIVSIIAALVACMFISGCGKSAPEGTDPVVKETVISIARKEMLSQLMDETYLRGLPVSMAEERAKKDPNIKIVLDSIKAQISKMKFKVVNVRVDSIDSKIGKSSNSADLQVDYNNQIKNVPITYTAQKNDKGQVYVEVFGLQ